MGAMRCAGCGPSSFSLRRGGHRHPPALSLSSPIPAGGKTRAEEERISALWGCRRFFAGSRRGRRARLKASIARRRTMAMRRSRDVPGVAASGTGRKRRRLDCCETEEGDEVNGVLLLPLDLAAQRDAEEVAKVPECAVKKVAAKAKMKDPREKEEAEEEINQCPGYGMTSVCGRRREMEDAVSIRPDFLRSQRGRAAQGCHFFGVFDGHGCSHVAVSCKGRMHEVVAEEVEVVAGRISEAWTPAEWKSVMERSFSRIDTEMLSPRWGRGAWRDANCRCTLQPRNDYVGSTAVVAVVSPGHVVVANCGDSRAVLCRGGVAMPLSSDHKPDRPDELQRIQKAGGRVIFWNGTRVLGVLGMSRAIGDNLLKPFVSAEPEVTLTEMTDDDEFLILASDGLWDVVSNSTACDVVRFCLQGSGASADRGGGAEEPSEQGRDKQGGSDKACVRAAILLTKLALARLTNDNVSVVVVDLRQC